MSTATQPLDQSTVVVHEVKEIFELNDVKTTGIRADCHNGEGYITARIVAPNVPLHLVARKIARCFCNDYRLEKIETVGTRFFEVTLFKTAVTPDPEQ